MKEINVTKEMWKQLHAYKRQGNFRNVNELIKWMLKEIERLQNEQNTS